MFDETIQSSPEPKKRLHDSIVYRKSKRKRRNNETEIPSINDETNSTINLETKHLPLSAISCECENDVEIEFVLDDSDAKDNTLEIEHFDINKSINSINLETKYLPLSAISSECDNDIEIEFLLDDIVVEENPLELETTDNNKTNLEIKKLPLSTLYWEDDDDNDDKLEIIPPDDIFAEEKLLEKANHGNFKNTNNYDKFITKGFETVTQFREKLNLNSLLDNTEDIKIAEPETQFNISETLFDNLCNEIKISDKLNVKFNPQTNDTRIAGCSKFLSPIKNPTTKVEKSFPETITVPMIGPETQFGISESQFAIFCNDVEDKLDQNCNNIKCESPKIHTPIKREPIVSLAQSIFDDFSELEVPDIDIALENSSYSPIVKFQFRDQTLRTYSVVKTKLNLSAINDIQKSQQITENLLNLNSFFSDSLVEIAVKEPSMLEYFQSKRNFNFSTSANSTEGFKGFPISDNENAEQNECSENLFDNKNENIDMYQEEIDIFNKHENNCKDFTQALLEKSVIGIANEIPIDSNSKNDFKKLSTVVSSTVLSQFSKNCNKYSLLETELPKDSLNDDDIFNSELCKDEDIFMEIKTQNCIHSESNNSITNTVKTNTIEYLNCQIPLKSKFNSLQSAIKTDEILKENSTPQENQVENQIFQGFKFASKKPVIISANAIKQAEKLIAKVLTEDISNLEEEENKENNPILNEEKLKKASDIKSIQISDDAYANDFLNGIDIDSFTDDFHSDIEMNKNSPKKNQLSNDKSNSLVNNSKTSPNTSTHRLLEANNFLNGISAEITNMQNAFNTVVPKHINNSEKSLLNDTNMEISEDLSRADSNFKVPNFIGFISGKGKPIKIPEKALEKATKMIQVFNKEINSEITLKNCEDSDLPTNNIVLKSCKEDETNLMKPDKSIVETNLENSEKENEITNLVEVKKIIDDTNMEISEDLSKTDNNFKVPNFIGFISGKGKPIKIAEKALEKATKMMQVFNKEINSEIILKNCEESSLPSNNIVLKSCKETETNLIGAEKSTVETDLENSEKENEITNSIEVENTTANPGKEIQDPKKLRKNSNYLPNKIYSRRVTRSSSRISNMKNTSLEHEENRKNVGVNNYTDRDIIPKVISKNDNTIMKNMSSEFNRTKSFINHKTDISTTSYEQLLHKTISGTQFSSSKPLRARRNILSLSQSNFKPPEPSLDKSFCTPNRNLRNTDKSLNYLETSNFQTVNIESSTPKIPSPKLTLTKDVTPSFIDLIKNNVNNSSFKDEMKMINWNEQISNDLSKTLSLNLNNKTLTGSTPLSTKRNLSLTRRSFKPPAKLITSFDENSCTPLRNSLNNNDKSLNCLETPNLKEFFKSVQCVETSTPKISNLQLSLTNELSPMSNTALMENKINNSSFNDEKMQIINCSNEQNTNDIPLSRNLTPKTFIGPSPKNRIGRLKMWNKPPELLPIAFIDECNPSGLRRNNSFSNKLNKK